MDCDICYIIRSYNELQYTGNSEFKTKKKKCFLKENVNTKKHILKFFKATNTKINT